MPPETNVQLRVDAPLVTTREAHVRGQLATTAEKGRVMRHGYDVFVPILRHIDFGGDKVDTVFHG